MTNNGTQEKAIVSDNVLDRTVQKLPDYQTIPGSNDFVISISSFADDIPAWGRQIYLRDRKLREFWPTETIVAGAIQTIVSARTNMSWTLDGPPRTVGILQRMLQSSNLGKGWLDLQIKVCTDLLTQDNGAFVEIVRQEDKPNGSFINLAHLDAGRCVRTGMADTPIIYRDRENGEHKLKWYQVISFEDMPSPIEEMNGLQVCFLSRVLRAAQTIRDYGIYKREKIAGRNPGVIHLVSGVQTKLVEDKLASSQNVADNQGYSRFMLPVVIGSLDPNANVNATSIDLRSVPDGFDEDTTLRWYVSQIAMAAGAEYQDFAPLTAGLGGTARQSDVLDRKSKGKGQETWRKMWEHKLNFSGIFPQSVTFAFDEKDITEDQEQAKLNDTRAKTYSLYFEKGVLPLNVVHQMMADDGILKPEYLTMLGTQDATPDIVATDDERAPTESELEDASGQNVDTAVTIPEEIPEEIRATKDSNMDISYGCLMLMMDDGIKELAMQIANQIDSSDLLENGIEKETHVTVKYGFIEDVTPEMIKYQIGDRPKLHVEVGNLSLFENDEFDVLKLNVDGDELRYVNGLVSLLPNEDSHPEYNPHMTIAYLKSGTGKKYLELDNPLRGMRLYGNLIYSDANENRTVISKSIKKKQIDTLEYEEILADLMRDAANGRIGRREFLDEAGAVVSSEIINTYLEASGKNLSELTAEDRDNIDEQTDINLDALPGLYVAAVEYGGDTETPTRQLIDNRVKLWGSGLAYVWALGVVHNRRENTLLEWKLGPTDHCSTCLDMSRLVLTRRQWREQGILPQSRILECGGYRCQCSLVETSKELTDGI